MRAFLRTNRYPVRVEGCLRGWCRPAQAPQDGWHPQGAKTRYPVHWRRSSGRLQKHPFSFNTSQAQYEVVAPERSFSVSLDREKSRRFAIILLPEDHEPEAPQSTSGYSESVLPRDRSSWAGSGRPWSELSAGDTQWVLGKGFRLRGCSSPLASCPLGLTSCGSLRQNHHHARRATRAVRLRGRSAG